MNSASFPEGIIESIKGKCLVLKGDDIDTDRIIPARFLKCVSFEKLGEQVFADDRAELKGSHPFDIKENQKSNILIVNDNFGCGSSREHAPQALMRWGIRGLIGQSFAEIFYGNCLALGIPCVTTSEKYVYRIQKQIKNSKDLICHLDLKNKLFECNLCKWDINIQNGPLEMFLTGRWDATSQLISNQRELDQTIEKLPYLNNFE